MQLSPTFFALALALGTTIVVEAAPFNARLLSLESQSKDSPLLSADLNSKTDGKDALLSVGVNLCQDPLLGLIECKTDSKTNVNTKPSAKPKAKMEPSHKGKGKPKQPSKAHHARPKTTGNEVGGNAQGGNGGNASGGSSDCSMGNSLIGVSTLNFNSCNGGNGAKKGGHYAAPAPNPTKSEC